VEIYETAVSRARISARGSSAWARNSQTAKCSLKAAGIRSQLSAKLSGCRRGRSSKGIPRSMARFRVRTGLSISSAYIRKPSQDEAGRASSGGPGRLDEFSASANATFRGRLQPEVGTPRTAGARAQLVAVSGPVMVQATYKWWGGAGVPRSVVRPSSREVLDRARKSKWAEGDAITIRPTPVPGSRHRLPFSSASSARHQSYVYAGRWTT